MGRDPPQRVVADLLSMPGVLLPPAARTAVAVGGEAVKPARRWAVVGLAVLCLPVAFFAVVCLRGVSPRLFWSLYWDEFREVER